MNPTRVAVFLKSQVPLFQEYPSPQLEELIAESRIVSFEPNEAIIEFGEDGRFLGIILDGEAEVSTADFSGERHQISQLKAGDVFGEMSLMTGGKTMADVIGLTRCEALLIPEAIFSSTLITYPAAIKILSISIASRLKAFAYDEKGQILAADALKKSDDPYGFRLRSEKPMKLLVVNCGSSSLKYNLFDTIDESRNARGSIEPIGADNTEHTCKHGEEKTVSTITATNHSEAFADMIRVLTSPDTGILTSVDEISAIGHRVVHGGDRFNSATVITQETLDGIHEVASLAPLHNPVNLQGIEAARLLLPNIPHVAVFDTSFHHTLPPYAYLYGLPYEYYEKHGIRRYGFHGMSHAYVALRAAEHLKRPYNELEIVSCHLGNGASICAVDHGRSIDTSMGLTPTQGLIMGSRCGDIDPSVLVHLMRTEQMTADDLDNLINRESGLKGLSGISNDMREIEVAAENGNTRALLAIKTFSYQVRKYIGAYRAAMGGLDALIFTGGIGQKGDLERSLACQGLNCMGIEIDETRNRNARVIEGVLDISTASSPVRVLVIATDEERMIARETLRTLKRQHVTDIIDVQIPAPIRIEVSAHHVHLSQAHTEKLFGPGHNLTPAQELSQPNQYACEEKVTLVGPKGKVSRVRVLGPARKETQVEISMTEQFQLGIQPPIRASGDIENSPGVTLEGSEGTLSIAQGVICALRHIHMSPEDVLQFGLRDKDMVRIRVQGRRELIFGDVLVRVHPDFRLAMHIDTDEANAANITTGMTGYLDSIQNRN